MEATAPVRMHRAPQPRWRLALLITVLAGFFLMHGLSSTDACAGATASLPGSTQSTAAMASTDNATQSAAMGGGSSSHVSAADQCCAAMGTVCLPQRPQDEAWLLVLLLSGLAPLPTGGATAGVIDAVRRIARAGRQYSGATTPVRLLGCVSRT